jgi:GAF domain-containing protein
MRYPNSPQEVSCLVSAPLLWKGEVIGVMTVLDVTENRRFSRNDMELLALFAGQAAVAIENARLLRLKSVAPKRQKPCKMRSAQWLPY